MIKNIKMCGTSAKSQYENEPETHETKAKLIIKKMGDLCDARRSLDLIVQEFMGVEVMEDVDEKSYVPNIPIADLINELPDYLSRESEYIRYAVSKLREIFINVPVEK